MEKQILKNIAKVFVWVPNTVTSFDGAAVSNGKQQIYFEEGTSKIWVNGKQFGVDSTTAADLANVKAILAGIGEGNEYTTVLNGLNGIKAAILGGASDSGNTLKKVEDRVSAIETLVGSDTADADDTINKLKEVLDWFANVKESETGRVLIDGVAANTTAIEGLTTKIGVENTASEGQESNATGLYKVIEDSIAALDVAENTVGDGNVRVTYSQTDGKVNIASVTVVETEATYTAAEGNNPANLEATAGSLLKGSSITAIKNYVDAKVIAANKVIKIANDSTDFAAVSDSDDHEISVKTSSLSNVKLEKVDGSWTASKGNVGTGLATADDVATKLVENEAIIAAGLNDHESRINTLENIELWDVYTGSSN